MEQQITMFTMVMHMIMHSGMEQQYPMVMEVTRRYTNPDGKFAPLTSLDVCGHEIGHGL
jgi:Zn-dependent metalloprotease